MRAVLGGSGYQTIFLCLAFGLGLFAVFSLESVINLESYSHSSSSSAAYLQTKVATTTTAAAAPTPTPTLEEVVVEEPPILTFEYYLGRFGNQIQQAEWVYRIAKMTNRTLVFAKPTMSETFVGLPNSWQEVDSDQYHYAMWDAELLSRSPVKLLFHGDVVATGLPEVHANCVWREQKFLASWAYHANQLPECRGRIHLATDKGIPNEYRSDTREFGVDPMLFWTHFRFNDRLFDFVDAQLDRMLNATELPTIGVHARTFREAKSTQQKVNDKVCGPQSRETAALLAGRVRRRQACGCPIVGSAYSTAAAAADITTTWTALKLNETCDLTKPDSLPRMTGRAAGLLVQHGFFIATDHEDRAVDALFLERGAKMLDFSQQQLLPVRQQHTSSSSKKEVELQWIGRLEALVCDLAALIQVDEFYGIPASSLTRAVCSWRMSMDKRSPMCELYELRTYSPRCSERVCGLQNDHCCSKYMAAKR